MCSITGEMAKRLKKHRLLLQRTRVQLQTPIWQRPIICSSSSRGEPHPLLASMSTTCIWYTCIHTSKHSYTYIKLRQSLRIKYPDSQVFLNSIYLKNHTYAMYMFNTGFLQVVVTQTLWIKHLFVPYDRHEKDPRTPREIFHVSHPWVGMGSHLWHVPMVNRHWNLRLYSSKTLEFLLHHGPWFVHCGQESTH